MDIVPKNKLKLSCRECWREAAEVVDLRCFSKNKKEEKVEKKNRKLVLDIVAGAEREKLRINLRGDFVQRTKTDEIRSFDLSSANFGSVVKSAKFSGASTFRGCQSKSKGATGATNFFTASGFLTAAIDGFLNLRSFTSKICSFGIAKDKDRSAKFRLIKPALVFQKSFVCFIIAVFLVFSAVFFLSSVQKAIEQKEAAIGESAKAYGYLRSAGKSAADLEFEKSINNFNLAAESFSSAKRIIDEAGLNIAGIVDDLPINTPVSTAESLVEAGENISLSGASLTRLLSKISAFFEGGDLSADSLAGFRMDINNIAVHLKRAAGNIDGIDEEYIPKNMRERVQLVKSRLPLIAEDFEKLSRDVPLFERALGSDREQKYLLLFQNNSEIRATGGFIGSYGILDVENGRVKNLFIEGIFNPDGQLKEKVVPPMPIQKISAAWSMHDANWFADFPTSAKKVALFYEKTGGPTVDGVIAITPNVIEKILRITGPIEMPEYNTVVDDKNFLIETQMQVEKLYDKEKNRPKQFLADLAPRIIEKLFSGENLRGREKIRRYLDIAGVIEESLREKHILLYHRDPDIEGMIVKRGWGGQVLASSGDYLSVVHSNINGYKTDAVIDEKITHRAEILDDGSIIDTVKIVRKHLGGDSKYDWYNRVNSDYMRVYVPLGSVLLEAKGHTVQDYEPPVDYSDFKIDPDVAKIESSMKIDPTSGTHIFEESGKTVFGNWVYVSPGEKVEVVYKYKLPYKVDFDGFTKPADRYSILIQKQSGSAGSKFSGSIKLPSAWNIVWNSENLQRKASNESVINSDLRVDRSYGVVFKR